MPRGKATKTIELIDAAKRILEEIQPAGVRAVCYPLFNEKRIPNMSKASTNRVSNHLTWAREQGIIPWAWIVDETREIERVPSWANPREILEQTARQYRRDWWQQQPCRIVLASEKSTVKGTVKPVTDRYGVGFLSLHGYSSATKAHDLAEDSRDDDRPLVIVYIGDWDPSGMHMSEVDLPGRLVRYGGEATIRRISLTYDDTVALGVGPSFSAEEKRRDPRYRWFVERYGRRCWELDALNPNTLRERIEGAISSYIEWPAWTRCRQIEAEERASLEMVVRSWTRMTSA